MSLILLRHTRPEVAEGVCYGRSDLALGADFDPAAAAALASLPPVSRIVTSTLARCRRLAETVAVARGLDLAVDARIAELDFGAWEGVAWSAVPRAELDAWAADFQAARPHGGESVAALAARVGAALEATEVSLPPVLWVTHAGVVRAACAIAGTAQGWETRLAFGDWLRLDRGAGPGA